MGLSRHSLREHHRQHCTDHIADIVLHFSTLRLAANKITELPIASKHIQTSGHSQLLLSHGGQDRQNAYNLL